MKNIKVIIIFLITMLIIIGGNKVFAKYIFETSQFLIAEVNLDRTPPILDVQYTNIINGDVIVTIKANEKIRQLEGWDISENNLMLSKTFSNNYIEDVTILDLAGNTTIANINVNIFDKVLPVVECTNITNSNTNHSKYANSQKKINLKIKISDNIEIKDIDFTEIKFLVGSTIISPSVTWKQERDNAKEKIYNLQLTNIKGNGILQVIFDNEFVTDNSDNKSIETTVNTRNNN